MKRAIVTCPTPQGRRQLAFSEPIQTISAHRYEEVSACLAEAEAQAKQGRWVVGFVSYDAAPAFDNSLEARRDTQVPLLVFGVFETASVAEEPADDPAPGWTPCRWIASSSPSDFASAVAQIKRSIAAGDTYQINYTIRLRSTFRGDPSELFRTISKAQDSDHAAFIDLGNAAVCSSSPELFFRRRGTRLESRPMKGTAPRRRDTAEDRESAASLSRDEKELAENTMIVDMVRNDLGRVANFGSVRVPALHSVETFPTVHQLTSTVEADSTVDLPGIFSALFPPASITGAPKISSCSLIAQLETEPRGLYTGTIGVLRPDGDCEFNVAIRTAWIDLEREQAEYGVGCGIVWDSDPLREWAELIDKSRVLGDGRPDLRLLETIRWEPEEGPTLLEAHLARLERTAARFGYSVDLRECRQVLSEVDADEALVLRLLCDTDGTLELQRRKLPQPPTRPWQLPFAMDAVRSNDEMLLYKTTARDVYEAAQRRFPDAPDVLLVNDRGEVTETTIGNVVVEQDGRLVTPPLSSGLLPGTLREKLLQTGEIVERPVRPEHLLGAPRAFMINSVRGWVAIEALPPSR